jgi:NADP-dependent 3-hydroxy acid dehydrogenase YdfG
MPRLKKHYATAALAFGGVDIIVNNAGISISKSITDHSIEDWDKLYDILVKGQFPCFKIGCRNNAQTKYRW